MSFIKLVSYTFFLYLLIFSFKYLFRSMSCSFFHWPFLHLIYKVYMEQSTLLIYNTYRHISHFVWWINSILFLICQLTQMFIYPRAPNWNILLISIFRFECTAWRTEMIKTMSTLFRTVCFQNLLPCLMYFYDFYLSFSFSPKILPVSGYTII